MTVLVGRRRHVARAGPFLLLLLSLVCFSLSLLAFQGSVQFIDDGKGFVKQLAYILCAVALDVLSLALLVISCRQLAPPNARLLPIIPTALLLLLLLLILPRFNTNPERNLSFQVNIFLYFLIVSGVGLAILLGAALFRGFGRKGLLLFPVLLSLLWLHIHFSSQVARADWFKGLGNTRVINAPEESVCHIPLHTPVLALFPRRTINLFTGAETCPVRASLLSFFLAPLLPRPAAVPVPLPGAHPPSPADLAHAYRSTGYLSTLNNGVLTGMADMCAGALYYTPSPSFQLLAHIQSLVDLIGVADSSMDLVDRLYLQSVRSQMRHVRCVTGGNMSSYPLPKATHSFSEIVPLHLDVLIPLPGPVALASEHVVVYCVPPGETDAGMLPPGALTQTAPPSAGSPENVLDVSLTGAAGGDAPTSADTPTRAASQKHMGLLRGTTPDWAARLADIMALAAKRARWQHDIHVQCARLPERAAELADAAAQYLRTRGVGEGRQTLSEPDPGQNGGGEQRGGLTGSAPVQQRPPDRARIMPGAVPAHPQPIESPNVLVLVFDALSRLAVHRGMPSLVRLLGALNSEPASSHQVFEFFRYHAIASNTKWNMTPLVTRRQHSGHSGNRVTPSDLFWHDAAFHQKGYATAWHYSMCDDMLNALWGVTSPQTDHESVAPFCHYDTTRSNFEGPYSMRPRCYGRRHVHEYSLQWVEQFFDAYRDVPRLATMTMMESHEGSQTVVQGADAHTAQFLSRLLSHHPNTVVVLMSDHGNHMGPYFEFSRAGRAENRLPALFVLAPRPLLAAFPAAAAALAANQQRFVTAFDIHVTLRHLARLPPPGTEAAAPWEDAHTLLGASLLVPLHANRTCRHFPISPSFCVCKPD